MLDPAAILIKASAGGVATAARVHDLRRGAEAGNALNEAVLHGAIRLLDDSETSFITAQIGGRYATFDPAASDDQTQGLYRVDLGRGQVRWVDAKTGECLQADGLGLQITTCDSASSQQRFNEQVTNLNGWDRYSYINGVGAITDAGGGTLGLTPWTGDPSQQFRMWLAPY